MKKRNTGLFSFCKNLVNALNESAKQGESLSLFLPEQAFDEFPDGMSKMKMNWWNSFYLPLPKELKVWHGTYQLSKYQPSGKVNKVLTIHDLNFLYERGQKDLKSGLKTLQKNIRNADVLVAISEYTKQDILKHLDLDEKEIQVIHNGCEFYKGAIIAPLSPPVRPFVFALGTVLAKKNFHVLPCLLYKNDFDLIIAGNVSSYSKKVMEEARKWGVQDRVHIIGPVEESVKHWYLKNCEAFLFPSIAEGFGLPVVESMSYGKPLFLSQHTSLPEVGGDAAFYFDIHFDPESMQSTFQEGMTSFKSAGKEAAIEKQRARFSWDRAAEKYWQIYHSLL